MNMPVVAGVVFDSLTVYIRGPPYHGGGSWLPQAAQSPAMFKSHFK